MALIRYLVDKSALVRATASDDARRRLDVLFTHRCALTCSVIDLELLYSARSSDDWHAVFVERRDGFERLDLDQAVFDRAIEVQGLLAATGHHRGPSIPDLAVAACAEMHGVSVLHYDKDFDVIAGVSGQATEWITVPPRGSRRQR